MKETEFTKKIDKMKELELAFSNKDEYLEWLERKLKESAAQTTTVEPNVVIVQ